MLVVDTDAIPTPSPCSGSERHYTQPETIPLYVPPSPMPIGNVVLWRIVLTTEYSYPLPALSIPYHSTPLLFDSDLTMVVEITTVSALPPGAPCLQDGPDPYQQWYAPVRSTLLLLSKLYRCVDTKIFAGLAQDAIAACTASVQSAAKLVGRSSGVLDSQLFIIQHLLFLREQIAPFEVDFAVTDVDLDFTHMRDHIRRIMTGVV